MRILFRSLLKNRPYALTVALIIGLSVGVSASILSLVDRVLYARLPFEDSKLIAEVSGAGPQEFVRFGPAGFELWPPELATARSFSAVGLYAVGGLNLGGEGARRVKVAAVTPSFFEVMRIRPFAGRTLVAKDIGSDERVAIISARLWQTQYGGRQIIGEVVNLNTRPFSVVGILGPRAHFPADVDVWVLPGADPQLFLGPPSPQLIGRLVPSATYDSARREFTQIYETASAKEQNPRIPSIELRSLEQALAGDTSAVVTLLWVAGALLFLVSCVNVTALALTRLNSQRREMAIRQTIGASRIELAKPIVLEAVILSAVGLVVAVPVLILSDLALAKMVPDALAGIVPESGIAQRASVVALLTAMAASLSSSVPLGSLFGLTRGQRLAIVDGSSPRWQTARRGLVALQIAGSAILLFVAIATVESARSMAQIALGVQPSNASTFRLMLPRHRYGNPDAVRQFYDRLEERLLAIPGISVVAASNRFIGPAQTAAMVELAVDGTNSSDPEQRFAHFAWVTPRFLEAGGTRLLAGRGFTRDDRPDSHGVAIVSDSFARSFNLTPQQALGRRVNTTTAYGGRVWSEVVGVVEDILFEGPATPNSRVVLVPHTQTRVAGNPITVILRLASHRADLIAHVQRDVAFLDHQLPVYDMRPMSATVAEFLVERQLTMLTMSAFAIVACALAYVGLYGLLSYAVQRRSREIGVRIAIGASPVTVIRAVMAEGVRNWLVGVSLGAAGGVAAYQLVQAFIPDLELGDWQDAVVVLGGLFVCSIVASWIPARRAANVDPVTALRAE